MRRSGRQQCRLTQICKADTAARQHKSDVALPSGKLLVTLPKTPLPADALVEADEEGVAMGTNVNT